MIFRSLLTTDEQALIKLSEQLGFPVPDVKRALFNGIIADEDGVIAYGQIEPVIEATIMIDVERDKKTRVQALKRLLPYAIQAAHVRGFKQVHGFVKNPEFAEIIKKHYNFQKTGGESLVLNL